MYIYIYIYIYIYVYVYVQTENLGQIYYVREFDHYAPKRHTRKHSIMPKHFLLIWHYTPFNNTM